MKLISLLPVLVILTSATAHLIRITDSDQDLEEKPKLSPRFLESLIYSYSSSTSSPAVCAICKTIIEFLQFSLKAGISSTTLGKIVDSLCEGLSMNPASDCQRLAHDFVEELAYIVQNSNHTPTEACSYYFSNINECHAKDFYAHFNWTVAIPGSVPQLQQLPPDHCHTRNVSFIHISDIHIDRRYTEGTRANCKNFICCEENSGTAKWFEEIAGKYGGGGKCDIPLETAETCLTFARENLQADFIIWTGDIPPHDIFSQTKEGNMQQIVNQVSLLKRHFPHIPIYPALGNHEPEPLNAFPDPKLNNTKYNQDYMYRRLNESWSTLFPNYNSKTVLLGGFYSANYNNKLKIISLNTNFGAMENWFLLINDEDPAGQLKWLVDELLSSEQNHQKVIIIAHIPPSLLSYTWGKNFNNIKNRFKNVIAGEYYGHTHSEQFEITYDENDVENREASNVAFIAPSVTTFGNHNPAFKIMTVDADTFIPCESETYYLNLTEANHSRDAEWKLLYKATSTYGLESFHPSEIHRFSERLKTDPELLHEYYTNMNRKIDLTPCTGRCVDKTVCQVKTSWGGAKLLC